MILTEISLWIKMLLTEILSLAKNYIDRDISLERNDIDREGQLFFFVFKKTSSASIELPYI